MLRFLLPAALLCGTLHAIPLSNSINALGCSLLRSLPDGAQNQLLSPYSIHSALAMTAAGASGKTLSEMLSVLSVQGEGEETLHADHGKLRAALEDVEARSARLASEYERSGMPAPSSTVLRVANRLFGEKTFPFLPEFLAFTETRYGAPMELLSFRLQSEVSRAAINVWVEKQTLSKIQNLLGPSDTSADTSLILVNALYLRAPWQNPFPKNGTRPEPFLSGPETSENVPTMVSTQTLGYRKFSGPDSGGTPFEAVSVPYASGALQFLVLLPTGNKPVADLESQLSSSALDLCSRLPLRLVELHLPKLHLAPPSISLTGALKSLGMLSAFDSPSGSADFTRMVASGKERLCVGNILHKTFLDLDEKGTEAAAATAVTMLRSTSIPGKREEPEIVKVDRPFLFAIQHVSSGTCLFLGRLKNPR